MDNKFQVIPLTLIFGRILRFCSKKHPFCTVKSDWNKFWISFFMTLHTDRHKNIGVAENHMSISQFSAHPSAGV